MTEEQRIEIIEKAKVFFQENIIDKHIANTKKLYDIDKFNINPFTVKYLANFAFGDDSPENIAKALLYPRILGTSISTTFGTQLQYFCNEVLSSFASTTSGIDIEFIDTTDNRKKYCQIKSGPTTINHDDVTTIKDHFRAIRNIARTNRMKDFNPASDCIVGVFYGESKDLSASYRKIDEDFPVYIGKDFWMRLTGDEMFYDELVNAFADIAIETDGREIIKSVLDNLTNDIKRMKI